MTEVSKVLSLSLALLSQCTLQRLRVEPQPVVAALVLTSLTLVMVRETYNQSAHEILNLVGADVQVLVLSGKLRKVQRGLAFSKRSLLKVFGIRLSLCCSAELLLYRATWYRMG